MKKGSALVTGAAGFIGRAALPMLVDAGYEVHAVYRSRPRMHVPGVRWYRADLLGRNAGAALVKAVRPTHLLHLAWYTTPEKYWASPENRRWVEASLSMLRAFAAAGGRRAVLAGTCAEYEATDGRCSERNTPLRPNSLYGACKNALQEMAAAQARDMGYSTAWARIFFPYGPGEPAVRLVPSVTRNLLAAKPVELAHADYQRDFLYVEDVASALVRLLSSDLQGPVNIASGEATSLSAVVSKIEHAVGRTGLVRLGTKPVRDDQPPVVLADATRLREGLEWEPTIPLDDGIARTVSWWQRQEAA
jgi:nucleoside-diphosphate-sugar epimerase